MNFINSPCYPKSPKNGCFLFSLRKQDVKNKIKNVHVFNDILNNDINLNKKEQRTFFLSWEEMPQGKPEASKINKFNWSARIDVNYYCKHVKIKSKKGCSDIKPWILRMKCFIPKPFYGNLLVIMFLYWRYKIFIGYLFESENVFFFFYIKSTCWPKKNLKPCTDTYNTSTMLKQWVNILCKFLICRMLAVGSSS